MNPAQYEMSTETALYQVTEKEEADTKNKELLLPSFLDNIQGVFYNKSLVSNTEASKQLTDGCTSCLEDIGLLIPQ